SISRNIPTSVASTRPQCSRKTPSTATRDLVPDRPHLDCARGSQRLKLGRHRERHVEVVDLDEDQAAQELLGVDEGSVGQQGLALLLTHRRGSLRGVQARPARNVRAGEDGSDPRLDHPSLLRSGLLGAVDQQGVLHDAPVLGSTTLRLLDERGAGERTRPGENFGSGCPSGDPWFGAARGGDPAPTARLPMLRPGQGGEVALQRLLVEAGIAGGDVVVPLSRHAGVVDDEAGAVLLAAEREADDRVHARVPFRRVHGAESPCLHDALARDKLDLTALDPAAEEAECLTHAVAELRGHAGGGGELLAVGQHLVDGLGVGVDDGFLVNEHEVFLCLAGRMAAFSWRRTEVPQTDTETAILAGGCFWPAQELLRHRDGVLSTRVGYTGGEDDNPTTDHHPGHAEAVEVTFDPARTSYRAILEFFFQIHRP